MKERSIVLLAVLLVGSARVAAAADSLNEVLQKGLLEEEANHNLEAAIQAYQSVIDQYNDQRKLAATAVFRLGECYRKQGKTNEAAGQYQRILQDFADQSSLIGLSERSLVALGRGTSPSPDGSFSATTQPVTDPDQLKLLKEEIKLVETEIASVEAQLRNGKAGLADLVKPKKDLLSLQRHLPENAGPAGQKSLVQQQIQLVEQLLTEQRKKVEVGAASPLDAVSLERELLGLKRELIAISKAPAAGRAATDAESPSSTDVETREVDRLRQMVRNSPDLVNARDRAGYGPLHHATRKGQRMVADFLLANGASVDLPGQWGNTPLHLAVFYGHKALVELLLSHRADINAGNQFRITPLHFAVERGFRLIAEALLANGAEVNSVCYDANLNLIDPAGKDPFQIGFNSGTPLHTAVRLGKTEFIELLLARKPDVNLGDFSGQTALCVAVMDGNVKLAERLLQAGANVNAEDGLGYTLLHRVVTIGGITEIVKWLLAHGANVNAKEKQGFTPLHLAAGAGNKENVQLLLAEGAGVNATDGAGETPLFQALRGYHKDMVEFLLTHGADPNVKSKENVSPVILTKVIPRRDPVVVLRSGTPPASADELADLLRKHGAKE